LVNKEWGGVGAEGSVATKLPKSGEILIQRESG